MLPAIRDRIIGRNRITDAIWERASRLDPSYRNMTAAEFGWALAHPLFRAMIDCLADVEKEAA